MGRAKRGADQLSRVRRRAGVTSIRLEIVCRACIVLLLLVAPVASGRSFAILNAHVWTGDPAHPSAEAIAIEGDRIAFVGTTTEVQSRYPHTEYLDAAGQLVLPGFIDSHVHFIFGGVGLSEVRLGDVRSRAEFVARVREFAARTPRGAWITGGRWDHTLWGGELPTRTWIDSVTEGRPAFLERLDGHMGLANSAALAAANVDRNTPNVVGGVIVRDADREPTGILKDNAMDLVYARVPTPSIEEQDEALIGAMRYVNAQGVTSVHNMGADWLELDAFARAAKAHRLTTRIYAAVPLGDWPRLRAAIDARAYGGADGRGDEWLSIGALKGFVDGSLGSHTAAMLEPYADAQKDFGLFVHTPEELYQLIVEADRAQLQVMVHAIGDRANRTILDVYERVALENGPRDRRFRVEHAQHLAQSDIPRFASLGVIASMMPYHAIATGRWAEGVIGPRIATTYAFRSLLDAHAIVAFGSDWSVAPATPLEGIYAAVTRRTLDDTHPGGWVPDQKITVEEALRAYTTEAAYAAFDETRKGRVAPGYLADLVVIDRDIRTIPRAEIRDAVVTLTMVGGAVTFKRF